MDSKIKSIYIKHYKRFTDLTVTGLPVSAKLVVLVGPNGCGKTSLFEAFNYWYRYRGFGYAGDKTYCLKVEEGVDNNRDDWFDSIAKVDIDFFEENPVKERSVLGKFYFLNIIAETAGTFAGAVISQVYEAA